MSFSIVIPALNEIKDLPSTIAALRALDPCPDEVIVADGGSTDGTLEWLESNADGTWLKVVQSANGRGKQMNEGARAATGETLLFLHADAVLPVHALNQIDRAFDDVRVLGGAFTIWFSGDRSPWSMPLIARGINARTWATATATGDQAIFVQRSVFWDIGGYEAWPLFEDVDLVTQIKKRGTFRILRGPVVISDRRYAKFGPWRTALLMWILRIRYWFGASPEDLKRAFVDVRTPKRDR